MSFVATIRLYGSSFLRVSDGSLNSQLAFATRVMRESRRTGRLPSGLPFYLRSACRAQNTPALRTHALLPKIRYAPLKRCGLLPPGKLWSPSTDSIQSPREWVATAHPLGKHVPQTADTTKRNGAQHHVQQNHPRRPTRSMQKPKPLRTTVSSSSSISQPRRAGRTTRENTRPAPNGTASMPGEISRSSPGPSRKGSSLPSKELSSIATWKMTSRAHPSSTGSLRSMPLPLGGSPRSRPLMIQLTQCIPWLTWRVLNRAQSTFWLT